MSDNVQSDQSRISVMIVDDHPLFREAVGRAIERSPDLTIVAEAADGQEAIELAAKLAPRVIVLDITLPKISGIEATKAIKSRCPGISIVVLSVHDDAEHVAAMLRAGADAYLTKDVMGAEIIKAIHQVVAGEIFLCSTALRHVVASTIEGPSNVQGDEHVLTPRELEILGLMAHGLSNRDIASRLSLSTATVKGHVEGVFAKLNVSSRTEAVTAALRLGILRLSDI